VPLPAARPRPVAVAAVLPRAKPEQRLVTASLAPNLFDNRASWRGAVEVGADLPPPEQASPFETASADPAAIGATPRAALAYAAETPLPALAAPLARARPMGSTMPRLPREAAIMPASSSTTVVSKPPLAPPMMSGGQRSDSPWLRAAMLTPSVSGFMTATRMGATDPRSLRELLRKPSQALVMTFSADPHLGMVADSFTGRAVVFLATATFGMQTASLR
jgi:hypothetical protein